MAKIKLIKPFTMDLEHVRKGMQDIADHLVSEEGMKYRWINEDRLEFSHKSGKGSLQIAGDVLQLELKISLLYAAAAPIVKKKIMAFADEYIH
ncbi:MAG: polyhydroxyalkanoic acid system family protein [Pseudomonadales bacterium]|nr:polyhydroxyalkanoic acid system family protein [Pseudomonadales bacterium]